MNPNDVRRRFTDDQLIQLHDEGLTQKEVARALGVQASRVRIQARRLGLSWRKWGTRIAKIPDDALFISLIALMYFREDLLQKEPQP